MSYEALAVTIARRSPQQKYKTGCVIVNAKGPVSYGWSHKSQLRLGQYYSVHAELHALIRANGIDLPGCRAFVATISQAGNLTTAKPCTRCAELMNEAGITS